MQFIKRASEMICRIRQVDQFMDKPILIDECKQYVEDSMQKREENFLYTVKELIYGYKNNPYRMLLDNAHIAFSDVQAITKQEGIEGALQILKDEGVYITFEEFKGRKITKRNGKEFCFTQRDFRNEFKGILGKVYSGTSQGSGTVINWGYEYLINKTRHEMIMFDMHGCLNYPFAIWYPIFPSHLILYAMRLRKMRVPLSIWYTPVTFPSPKRVQDFFDLYMYRIKVLHKISLKYVPLDSPYPIAEWAACMIKQYGKCSISAFCSGAVRICLAAKEKGLSIRGTVFFVAGEPLTQQKREEIEGCGCKVVNAYYFSEGGFVGCSCISQGSTADEIHFFKDCFAIIQHKRNIPGYENTVGAFLVTSFYKDCPILMLNLENGDYGTIKQVDCAHTYDDAKKQHIMNIRSFEKLTTEGVTFYINDFIPIIEERFPRKFGGSSIGYQLVEDVDKRGLSRLILYIHPDIVGIDEREVKNTLYKNISTNINRDIRLKMWEQIKVLRIRREVPLATVRGKIISFVRKD